MPDERARSQPYQPIIADFADFSGDIVELFEAARAREDGAVADYIPEIARVDPNLYAMSLCTIGGHRLALGDRATRFTLQSCCKPVNYCMALEEHGETSVHRYVGCEPSGRGFNELTLNHEGKPHNPMINAGAIMICSLIEPSQSASERLTHIQERWKSLSAGEYVGFNDVVYQSERQTADRNFALGYMLREHRAFPEGADLMETLDLYFRCCSLEVTVDTLAVTAATLAAGGVNPLTGEKVLRAETVRDCLTLMSSCGMYDYSGQFAFSIGLPAKSGVSGGVMVVVPNVMGLGLFSPRLGRYGNSIRGVEFCRRMVERFNFHMYDNLLGTSGKKDPRRRT